MDVKINGATYSNIEYIAVPKADGSGNATFRNVENYYNDGDLQKYLTNTLTHLDDQNGQITGALKAFAFKGTGIQYINLPSISSATTESFFQCPELEEVRLDNCKYIWGSNTFSENRSLKNVYLPSLIGFDSTLTFRFLNSVNWFLGQNQVTYCSNNYADHFYQSSGNRRFYVPSDLLRIYKSYSLWGNESARFRSIQQYDKDETDYVLYQIQPVMLQISGNAYIRPQCTYTTSVETTTDASGYIVGRATDTLQIVATCYGYLTKTFSVPLDSSEATVIRPDFTDMQIDPNYNGYNIMYMDFCKFQPNLGVRGNGWTSGQIWSAEDVRHLGIRPPGGNYAQCDVTLPDLTGMTSPTFVFEAVLGFEDSDSTSDGFLFSPNRGGGIKVTRNKINVNGALNIIDLNLNGYHHYGFVLNQSSIYVYLDGVLLGSTTTSNYYTGFNRSTYRFFKNWDENNTYFNGRVKQMSVCVRDIADPSSAQDCEFMLPIPQQANP